MCVCVCVCKCELPHSLGELGSVNPYAFGVVLPSVEGGGEGNGELSTFEGHGLDHRRSGSISDHA